MNGLQLDRGYLSPYFVTDTSQGIVVLDNPKIIVCNMEIISIADLSITLSELAKSNQSVLILAEDFVGEALNVLIASTVKGVIKAAVVKAPYYGERRRVTLEDAALVTGATLISPDKGINLASALECLGSASRVVITKDTTTIIGGTGDTNEISKRVQDLRSLIQKETKDGEKQVLKERLAKLSNGIAIMHVGAATEVEMKEKKDSVS